MSNETSGVWGAERSGTESREELESKKREFIRNHADAIFAALEYDVAGVKVPHSGLVHGFADKILRLVPRTENMDTSLQPQLFRDMTDDLHAVLVDPGVFQSIPNREKILQLIEEIQELAE